ncbi:hypothetical protein [Frankia sp. Mgl5]|nr:hypothetical protein [Frankia sp. Mgl5]
MIALTEIDAIMTTLTAVFGDPPQIHPQAEPADPPCTPDPSHHQR